MAQALVVGLVLFLAACGRGAPGEPAQATQSMQRLTLNRTKNGVRLWTLQAEEAAFRDSDGLIDLRAPRAEVFQEGRRSSTVTAAAGVFDPGSQDLRLEKDVVVSARESGGPVVLRTERLDYDSRRETYRTDSPVLIERGGSTMRGKGLTANRDLSEINVREQETVVR